MEPNIGSRVVNKNQKLKVRVFILNAGEWRDCGTGILNFHREWNEKTDEEEEYLEITSPDIDKKDIPAELLAKLRKNRKNCVFLTKISKENNYERQKGCAFSTYFNNRFK